MTEKAASLASIGRRASMWRAAKGYGLTREHLVAKLAEETGEVARAVIGDIEERPGRGDARREAAQTVIVLASLLDLHYPGPPLFDEVLAELDRMGAPTPDNTDSLCQGCDGEGWGPSDALGHAEWCETCGGTGLVNTDSSVSP